MSHRSSLNFFTLQRSRRTRPFPARPTSRSPLWRFDSSTILPRVTRPAFRKNSLANSAWKLESRDKKPHSRVPGLRVDFPDPFDVSGFRGRVLSTALRKKQQVEAKNRLRLFKWRRNWCGGCHKNGKCHREVCFIYIDGLQAGTTCLCSLQV